MALDTLYKTVNSNGEYSCGDIGISTKEWLELLNEAEAKPYLDALYCFLREPEHKGTCSNAALKYGKPAAHYNSKVTNFSKWVQKKLNRFHVMGTDGNETYWCITMQKGWDTKQGFQWQLRDELAEALQAYLMKNLISQYSTKEPFNGFEEEYKWVLLDKTEGMDVLDIIKSLRGQNIVDNARVDGVLKTLWETKPEELTAIGTHLLNESRSIDERLATFKAEMRSLCPSEWKTCANDERTAAAILMCKYPEKYTVYKDEVYQLLCQYFGFDNRKAGQKFTHFIEIINKFAAEFGESIQEIMMPQIGKYRNKPLILAVQTLFWCMRHEMTESLKREQINYWLTGYTFGDEGSQFDRFIEGGIWESKHNDGNASDQKLLPISKSIAEGDIIILKSTSTKGKNHDLPFMRIKAVGIVTSNVTTYRVDGATMCKCTVEYVNTEDKDFDGSI